MRKRKALYLSWGDYFRETNQYPIILKRKDEQEIFNKLNNMRKEIECFVDEIYQEYDGRVLNSINDRYI